MPEMYVQGLHSVSAVPTPRGSSKRPGWFRAYAVYRGQSAPGNTRTRRYRKVPSDRRWVGRHSRRWMPSDPRVSEVAFHSRRLSERYSWFSGRFLPGRTRQLSGAGFSTVQRWFLRMFSDRRILHRHSCRRRQYSYRQNRPCLSWSYQHLQEKYYFPGKRWLFDFNIILQNDFATDLFHVFMLIVDK